MKKKLINTCALLLTAGLLAGCGSNDEMSLQNMEVEKYVTLGQYNGIEVTVEPIVISDSEVAALVDQAYNSNITAENGGVVDRAVAVGDTANIDYVGKKDDVAFDGGTAQGYNLAIGSGTFIDGFEEGLVGVMPGETVDLNLTFPEEYHSADLAGAEVVFTVTVNFIMPTEKSDDVVAALGIEDVNTVEELRQHAYDYLYANAEYSNEATVQNTVLSTFMNSCVFEEIPEKVIEKYKEMAREGVTSQAQSYGTDAETFVSYYYGMTVDEFVDAYSVEAAKQDIALQAVANKEGLNVTEEELNTAMAQQALSMGYADVEAFLEEESAETFRDYLVCDKAFNFLVENAVIIESAE
uniref:trigger factor n=1 Tax=Acetatifactor sp. TaxID=1872090 RepID=UPI0040572F8D